MNLNIRCFDFSASSPAGTISIGNTNLKPKQINFCIISLPGKQPLLELCRLCIAFTKQLLIGEQMLFWVHFSQSRPQNIVPHPSSCICIWTQLTCESLDPKHSIKYASAAVSSDKRAVRGVPWSTNYCLHPLWDQPFTETSSLLGGFMLRGAWGKCIEHICDIKCKNNSGSG